MAIEDRMLPDGPNLYKLTPKYDFTTRDFLMILMTLEPLCIAPEDFERLPADLQRHFTFQKLDE